MSLATATAGNDRSATRLAARAAELVLAAVIGVIAAQALWFALYGGAAQPIDVGAGQAGGASTDAGPRVDLAVLSQSGLFAAREAGPAPVVPDAPETRLNLTLRGVRTGADPQSGSAVIETPGAGQRALAVGMEIAPGVVLREIYPDRVIIDRRGARESLFLREEAARRAAGAPRPVAPAAPAAAPGSGLTAEDWIDGLRLEPVLEAGGLSGFRIGEGTSARLLQASGLQPGDVVTSLNGVALTNAEAVRSALTAFESTDTARFTVRRAEETLTLSVSLGAD
ncbi:MAG: type II secretion system protein N [Oceanicaulis sp.]